MIHLALVVPVWKRATLTNHLLTWYHAQRIAGVRTELIVVGSEGNRSRALARGLRYVEAPNEPIDAKYDAGFRAARDLRPDAVCLVGSDDFLTDRWFSWSAERLGEGLEFTGLLDFHLADLPTGRILYWGGYDGDRKGQPIAGGCVYARSLLERLEWRPYHGSEGYQHKTRDDERAYANVRGAGGATRLVNMAHVGCQFWAVKTGQEWNPTTSFTMRYPLVDITPCAWRLFQRSVVAFPGDAAPDDVDLSRELATLQALRGTP